METRYIEITLETAKRWYEQGGELRDMARGVFSLEEMGYSLPRSWIEYEEEMKRLYGIVHYDRYDDKNPQIAAVKKLIVLRDFYNNYWKPKWGDILEDKFSIDMDYKKDTGTFEYSVMRVYKPASFLVFNNPKYAEEFINNFRDLIEQAGGFNLIRLWK